MSRSKPIRMHFCCTPRPLLTQSPLPVLMMSLTAVNTVSMETPTTALAYISGSSPSLHSRLLPLTPPPPKPPHHPPDKKGGLGHKRRRRGAADRKLTAAERKKERTFTEQQKHGLKSSSSGLVICVQGCALLCSAVGVFNSCLVLGGKREL